MNVSTRVCIVPALTLYQFRMPELTIKRLRWPGLVRHIFLVRRRDRSFSVAAQDFYNWVMARRPLTDLLPRATPRRR